MNTIPQLWGLTEAALHLGITPARLCTVREHPQFPHPVAQLACGPIFVANDIRAFGRIPRPPGRRPHSSTKRTRAYQDRPLIAGASGHIPRSRNLEKGL